MEKNKNTLLIVEDEEALVFELEFKFKQEGFNVIKAGNGELGLEMAEKNKPDIILLDIVMPKMDGLTMLKKLREQEWGKEIPVLVLSNYDDLDKISQAMQSKAQGYLIKSDWDIEEVVKKVREVLKL